MQFRNIIAAGIIAIGTLAGAAAPASAGGGVGVSVEFGSHGHGGYDRGWGNHHRDYTLSPNDVRRILRYQGFHEVRYVDRQGSIYRALAENYRGRGVFVTVSARSGRILGVSPLRRRG